MSESYQYILKGKFSGTFRTLQKMHLNSGEAFPLNELHKIKIHRGVITDAKTINETEYKSSAVQCRFNYIDNIQINTSANWPIKNDRIFSLGDLILNNVEFQNVQLVNEKTYGEIKADIVATVFQQPFNKGEENEGDNKDKNRGGGNNGNGENSGGPGNTGSGGGFTGGGNTAGGGNGLNGCLPNIWKWLKWILLFLFLCWLISTCTQFGGKINCHYKLWKNKREYKKVKEEADSLQSKLKRIKPVINPCQIENFKGTNEPRTYTYNLGKQSGQVEIWYDMYIIPDRMEVYYNGQIVGETNEDFTEIKISGQNYDFSNLKGFAQKGNISFDYKYKTNAPTELLVRIIPNQQFNTTQWTFSVSCPN